MNIGELKELIKDLPNEMEIINKTERAQFYNENDWDIASLYVDDGTFYDYSLGKYRTEKVLKVC